MIEEEHITYYRHPLPLSQQAIVQSANSTQGSSRVSFRGQGEAAPLEPYCPPL